MKFNYNPLRIEKALGNLQKKSDNNMYSNNVRRAWVQKSNILPSPQTTSYKAEILNQKM